MGQVLVCRVRADGAANLAFVPWGGPTALTPHVPDNPPLIQQPKAVHWHL